MNPKDILNNISPEIISELKGIDNLSKFLKVLLKHTGEEIINNSHIYNIINDLSKVIHSNPQYRYILRSIFEWKILNIIKFRKTDYIQIDLEAKKFAQKTGFNEQLVLNVFIDIANGFGNNLQIPNIVNETKNPNTIVCPTQVPSVPLKSKSSYIINNGIGDFINKYAINAIDANIIQYTNQDSNEVRDFKSKIFLVNDWNDEAGIVIKKLEIRPNLHIEHDRLLGAIKSLEISYKVAFNDIPDYSYSKYWDTYDNLLMLYFGNQGNIYSKWHLVRNKSSLQRGNIQREDNVRFPAYDDIGAILLIPGGWTQISDSYRYGFGYRYKTVLKNLCVNNTSNSNFEITYPHMSYERDSLNLYFLIKLLNIHNSLRNEILVIIRLFDDEGDEVVTKDMYIPSEYFKMNKSNQFFYFHKIEHIGNINPKAIDKVTFEIDPKY